MFERFTDGSRRVLRLANDEARLLGSGFLGCEHLLLGLLRVEDGIAAQVLDSFGVTYARGREAIARGFAESVGTNVDSPPLTRSAKNALELSLRTAQKLGHESIGTEDILLGLIQAQENLSIRALKSLGISPTAIRDAVLESLHVALPPEGLPRSERVESSRFLGPAGSIQYPIRVVPGPSEPIAIRGLVARIVGVLFFDEEFEIVWSISGEYEELWSLLGNLEDDDHPPAGTTPRWVMVADDVGTIYERESRTFVREPSRWCGHVTCWPVPPTKARLLRLTWMDHSIDVPL